MSKNRSKETHPAASALAGKSRQFGHRQLKRLKARHRSEKGFRAAGLISIIVAILMLGWLLTSLAFSGISAFWQHQITIEVELSEKWIDPKGDRELSGLLRGNYRRVVQEGLYASMPALSDRKAKRDLFALVSASGATNQIRQMVASNPELIGRKLTVSVPTSDDVDQFLKGYIDRNIDEELRALNDRQIAWVDQLVAQEVIQAKPNWIFFFGSDSRDPELAGIAGAVMGSALALVIAFLVSFPIGVGAAIYLEEFAPKNWLTSFLEVNINNLAAVPSIVFGLLGLTVFLGWFGDFSFLKRSYPLVGGLVLALMTFPTIIIATRAALKAVPQSIYDGALSVGASHSQAIFHHKIPLSASGILTGSILGMAQALGETAPLLMIGMVAFVTEIPGSFTEPATALPVQIFLWSDSPERAWEERTSAAILVLLVVLAFMNIIAILLRNRFEKRW